MITRRRAASRGHGNATPFEVATPGGGMATARDGVGEGESTTKATALSPPPPPTISFIVVGKRSARWHRHQAGPMVTSRGIPRLCTEIIFYHLHCRIMTVLERTTDLPKTGAA
ncbi:hypothetical protein FKM82_027496 [Ascaphus truei]